MPDTKKAFKVIANDFVFHFDETTLAAVDLLQKSATTFNCIHAKRSVNAMLLETDSSGKKIKLAIDGEIFSIEIKDQLDQLIEKMGLGAGINKHLDHIKAPMPGLVLEITVTEGQQLHKGDKVLVLEAMKMENSIVIPADAIIKKILVSKGQVVERGQVMVELGPG